MAKIKIKDLPKDTKVSKKEMKNITGGSIPITFRPSRDLGGFIDPHRPRGIIIVDN